jgi:hypothetical protein
MVEGIATRYLHMAEAMEEQFLLVHRHYPRELATINTLCGEHFEAFYSALLNIFERAIERGQQDGSILMVPVRKNAMILLSTVDGIVRFKTLKLWDANQLVDELIRIIRKMLETDLGM